VPWGPFYAAYLRYLNVRAGFADVSAGRLEFALMVALLADEGVAWAAERRALDVSVRRRGAGGKAARSGGLNRFPLAQNPYSPASFRDDRVPVFLANSTPAVRLRFLVQRLERRYTELTTRRLAVKSRREAPRPAPRLGPTLPRAAAQ